ncbi:MAG: RNA polymerase sigma-70 factor [Bacteroidetes bacterium]|nr:RNA polymerase sigma-70 factor [Bacteroidota bacterium]
MPEKRHSGTKDELSLLKGDNKEFAQLYSRYYPLLIGVTRSYLPKEQAGDDLVQDVFEKLWLKRTELEIDNLRAYLFGMMRNRCLDELKRRKASSQLDQVEEMADEQEGMAKMEAKDQGTHIQELIQRLSPQCRTVFLLVRFEGMKYKEVAELLNISVKTVENHMGRALKVLRLGLDDRNASWSATAVFLLFAADFQPITNIFNDALGVKGG